MLFIILFLCYAAAMTLAAFKYRKTVSFISVSSFIAGISQMIMLFLVFLLVFYGVRSEKLTINGAEMLEMYFMDFAIVVFFLVFVLVKLSIGRTSLKAKQTAKEILQLFLPVLILNLLIRFLPVYDSNENGYVYMHIADRYLFATLFKLVFAAASLMLFNCITIKSDKYN